MGKDRMQSQQQSKAATPSQRGGTATLTQQQTEQFISEVVQLQQLSQQYFGTNWQEAIKNAVMHDNPRQYLTEYFNNNTGGNAA